MLKNTFLTLVGRFLTDETIKNLAEEYMKKARNNIVTMELLDKVINFKDILELPRYAVVTNANNRSYKPKIQSSDNGE